MRYALRKKMFKDSTDRSQVDARFKNSALQTFQKKFSMKMLYNLRLKQTSCATKTDD